jgi:hypothetical protein
MGKNRMNFRAALQRLYVSTIVRGAEVRCLCYSRGFLKRSGNIVITKEKLAPGRGI